MSYRYIALLDAEDRMGGTDQAESQHALTHARMIPHRFCDSATLYASEETPVLFLPAGTVVIGHLFNSEGKRVTDGRLLPADIDDAAVRQHVLQNFWGEYLLIQPSKTRTPGFTAMRDPSGGIRCVYRPGNSSSFITSDLSLATDLGLIERRIDWDFIPHCLVYPHLKTERSAILGVRELLPGCSVTLHGSSAASRVEWSPWDFVVGSDRPTQVSEAANDLRNTIAMVVKAWADTDRYVLLELSGGLDSSIVAACLRGTSVRVECCNLRTVVPGADEQQYARLMSDLLGVDLQVEVLGFEHARFEFTPPTYAVTPRVWVLQYAADQIKASMGNALDVASYFSGGGGDSVFSYLSNASPAADAWLGRGLRPGLKAIRELSELHQCTFWKAARLTVRKALGAPKRPIAADASFLTVRGKASKPADHPWFAAPAGVLPGDRERVHELLNTQNFRDGNPRSARRWLRMPLLSQPVVEACLRVPTWMWISGGRNRSVARSAFADLLPPEILNRRSKGTYVNYSGAVFRRNKEAIRDFLLTGELHARGLLDTAALQRLFQNPLPVQEASFMRMYELCMAENWVRHQSTMS
ncbi:asparagine synthase [Luteimonas sp. XNQY3]|nr:asparagine synthase-related protein [Luteimonas sp. XNQY3]MCD9007025.1 asparagine synthase [Luteimonas sp. XNQY3]